MLTLLTENEPMDSWCDAWYCGVVKTSAIGKDYLDEDDIVVGINVNEPHDVDWAVLKEMVELYNSKGE